MRLINLNQISGGVQLQKDVEALLKSYDAAKVLTKIAKTVGEGEDPANYNAEELLSELKSKMDEIAGDGALSLKSLNDAITGLKDKKIKDMVRVTFSTDSEGTVTLDDGDLADLVPGYNENAHVPVYSLDNDILYNGEGDQLTLSLKDLTLNGIPHVIDATATAADEDGNKVYKPYTTDVFNGKVFPVGEWTLEEFPTDALLDNAELQLVAYKTALDKIVVELAKDKDLIAKIQEQIGEEAIKDVLDDTIKDLNDKIDLKEDKTVVKELSDRVDALEAGLEEEIHDRVQILSKVDSIDLSRIPNTKPVSIEINHLTYLENDGTFNVNREDKKITWLFNEANEGFDIDETLTDFVFVNYYSNKVVEPEELEEPEAGE